MGCPNFFKYHPDATLEQYCQKFGYDKNQLLNSVKKTKEYARRAEGSGNTEHNEERVVMNVLRAFDTAGVTDKVYNGSIPENQMREEREYNAPNGGQNNSNNSRKQQEKSQEQGSSGNIENVVEGEAQKRSKQGNKQKEVTSNYSAGTKKYSNSIERSVSQYAAETASDENTQSTKLEHAVNRSMQEAVKYDGAREDGWDYTLALSLVKDYISRLLSSNIEEKKVYNETSAYYKTIGNLLSQYTHSILKPKKRKKSKTAEETKKGKDKAADELKTKEKAKARKKSKQTRIGFVIKDTALNVSFLLLIKGIAEPSRLTQQIKSKLGIDVELLKDIKKQIRTKSIDKLVLIAEIYQEDKEIKIEEKSKYNKVSSVIADNKVLADAINSLYATGIST